jgi:sensor c-di-GMP phosphodiesterase-like protein
MQRRRKILFGAAIAALLGVAVVFSSLLWLLWNESVASETAVTGGLAAALGRAVDNTFEDARGMLAGLDELQVPRCSEEHLRAMQDAAISRPYVRAIGYWQAAKRVCGVGLLPSEGLRPPRADRVYPGGVVAWWPGPQTEYGGVQLFLMRLGDHDVAIDPRLLLDMGSSQNRQAVLWVDHLRMSASPWDVTLPPPESLPLGVSIDHVHGRLISRFTHNELLPIDVLASESMDTFLQRHSVGLFAAAGFGLLLAAGWIYVILRFSRHRLSLASELRQGLTTPSLAVKYQPVVELATGRCVGAEALARWERENGERVGPGIFVPVAEEAGLMQDLTCAVLRIAIRDASLMRQEFPEIGINVNLSADDLKNDRTDRELVRLLGAASLSPGAIKLEITERALINSDVSRALIREFRRRGHQVAIDDFGTGYCSLAYLQTFDLDVLKIDKLFVVAIGTEAATSQVIGHVIEMAKSLHLDTVAEGIETPEQVEWLTRQGVRLGQGFLFSRPLTLDEFLQFLRANVRKPARAAHEA